MASRPSLNHRFVRIICLFAGVCLIPLLLKAYIQSSSGQAVTAPAGAVGTVVKPTFRVARSFPESGNPAAVAAVDLNGDGRLDLVVANAKTGAVSVFLRQSDGSFQKAASYPTGKNPVAVATADFNGDGRVDVIVANQGDNSVSLLLGNGDGTLQKPVTYSVPKGPVFVAAADLTGKGYPDLLVASPDGVAVLRNNGDGSFQAAKEYSIRGGPQAIATGDFNGDGRLDLASANSDGSVAILSGDGLGSFNAQKSVSVGKTLSSIAVSDFDRDGHADLAVADSSTDLVYVLLGNGDGSFRASAGISVGHGPISVAAADLNGDGTIDLVAANQLASTVSVLLGKGDGSFGPSTDFVVGNSPLGIVAADFDGHGRVSLATANFADGTISTPLGNGDGTFQAAQSYRTNLDVQAIAAGDLDGDGHLDLVVTNFCGTDAKCVGSGSATVFLSTGNGTFTKAQTYELGKGPIAMALADVNGDKKLDLLALNQSDSTLMVMLGNGEGTFQHPSPYAAGNSPVSLAVTDFNKDGKPDIAIVNRCASDGCNGPGQLTLFLANGDGSFRQSATYQVGFSPSSVASGDLNGDGNVDLVVANTCGKSQSCTAGSATILLGDGTGKFKAGTDLGLGQSPNAIALGNLSGKKTLDLVVTYQASDQIGVLQGNGDGTFKDQVSYSAGSAPSSVIVGDFNGDGRVDVAVANLKSSNVSLLNGNGDGTLQSAVNYAVGSAPNSIISADLTATGHPSIVAANATGVATTSHITLLQNLAGPTPNTTTMLSALTKVTYGTPVTFTANVSPTPNGGTVTFFDGTTDLSGAVSVDNNGNASFTTAATQLSAGDHPISASYSGHGNSDPSSSDPSTQTVEKLGLTVTAQTNSKIYDGTPNATAVPVITSGSIQGSDTANFTESYDNKNVGTGKTLMPSGAVNDGNGGNNYSYTFVNDTTGVISVLAITVTAVSDTKKYDATTASSQAPNISPGLGSGDTSGFSQTFDTVNVGSGKTLTPSGSVNDGNSGNNYSVTFAPVNTGTIQARPLTVKASTNTKPYDSTTSAAALPTITSGTLQGTDTANFTEVYSNQHAGTGKTLIPSGNVNDGNGGNNYTYSFVNNTTGVITALPLTVTANTNTKPYDGNTSAAAIPSITSGTLQGSDTANFIEAYNNKHVGTGKTLIPSGNVNDGNSGKDYSYTFVNDITGVITVQSLTVTAVTNTKTYDGTNSASAVPTITSGTLQSGDKAAFIETYDTRNVGTGKTLTPSGIVNDGNGGQNYTYVFAPDTTGIVNLRAITVTAIADTKTYDGTTSSSAVPSAPGIATGDTANFIETFDTRDVGTGKTLTASGTVNDGNSGNNYSYTFVTNTSGVINKRPIHVAAVADSKTYDGTTSSSGTPAVTNLGIATGDSPNFIQAFDNKKVGTGKTLTPSGTVNDGNSGNNYSITLVSSATGSITQRSLTVTATADGKVYDGGAAAVAHLGDDRVAGDLFTDSFSSAAFSDKNAAAGKTVTVAGISIPSTDTTTDAPNYHLANTTATATATITPSQTASFETAATVAINDSKNGAIFTFSVIVTPQHPQVAGSPSGTVTFNDGSTTLGTGILSNGPGCLAPIACATFSTTAGQLLPGAHTITASFASGDGNFVTSQFANAITVVSPINATPGVPTVSQFSLNNPELNPLTVNLQCTVASATVSQTVSFPKCTVNPPSTSLPNPTPVTVTISTVATSSSVIMPGEDTNAVEAGVIRIHSFSRAALSLSGVGILGLVLLARTGKHRGQNRRLRPILGLILLIAIFAFVVGCGGGFNNPSNIKPPLSGNTQAGTYVVTVTGTDPQGKAVAVATIPFNVQF